MALHWPQTVIVAGARDARTQQPLPPIDGPQDGSAEDQELHIVVRRVAGTEQVVAELVGERPVVVLAGSVHARKRLLVQQRRQSVLRRDLLQHLHRHHLMIDGEVGVLEDRRDLILTRRHFVVPRLHRHAELEELELRFRHAGEHARGDVAEVLVFHFLALGRLGAEERAAAVEQGQRAEGRRSARLRVVIGPASIGALDLFEEGDAPIDGGVDLFGRHFAAGGGREDRQRECNG